MISLENTPEFRGIIRIAGKDVKGELSLARALTRIRGIGINLADSLAEIASREIKIDKFEKVGNLTDDQIDKLETILKSPADYGIPKWALNRRKDKADKDSHLIGPDLDFITKQTIDAEKNIKSYRGVRHMFGLPVRGQRTKTMGRKGMTLGVTKKKIMPTVTGKKDEGRKGRK